MDSPGRKKNFFLFIGMKVNTNTLSQPALCYHCLQCDVGGRKVCGMRWEERVHRHQQRKVHSLLPRVLLSEKVAFNYRPSYQMKRLLKILTI